MDAPRPIDFISVAFCVEFLHDHILRGHLGVRAGRAVGACAVAAWHDAASTPDTKCDQLQCSHLGVREGWAVGACMVAA
eukprot:8238569-Karenia_brevis.AAC.1